MQKVILMAWAHKGEFVHEIGHFLQVNCGANSNAVFLGLLKKFKRRFERLREAQDGAVGGF
jgi:hypothetical protein